MTKNMARALPQGMTAASPPAVPGPRWQGALEGQQDGLMYGWAVDRSEPNARVVLEACLDDEVFGCVIADLARPDLDARIDAALGTTAGDYCHGFVADFGALRWRQSGILTVRVANSTVVLPGALAHDADADAPVGATSGVFGDGSLRLQGWAVHTTQPGRIATVAAYLGQRKLATACAGMAHPGLRGQGIGQHGFALDLPPDLADGQVHQVRVVDQDGQALNGSPVAVCCFAGGARALLEPAQRALLEQVIDAYERHLPRSIGMPYYPAWSAQFAGALDGSAAAPPLRVGLIVGPEGGQADTLRTADSLAAQSWGNVRLFCARGTGNGDDQAPAEHGALLDAALRADCDVIGHVRGGDTLPPHALAQALQGFALAGAELVYTDSERAGRPWFKPAWNPDYALASDYPLELMLARAPLWRAARAAAAPAGAAALAWQVLAALWPRGVRAIVHVPHVLYHFHSVPDAGEQQARFAAAGAALRQIEQGGTLAPLAHTPADSGFIARQVVRSLSSQERQRGVTLIIPTRDRTELLERCIDSLERHTDWPQLEILVVDNDSRQPASLRYLRRLGRRGVRVLAQPGAFNFAALNNAAVAAAGGEIVGLVNNDIEALHPGWLDEMVGQLLRPGVGAVGAKLLWPNGMVQHGGVVLGIGNVAGHYGNRLADGDWGDHGRNQLVQQVSGVTAACLLLRKRDYLAVGGMDERAFPVAFNDVDLCLKLRRAGLAIVWTPHARLLHAESASRGHEDTPPKRARAQREVDQLRQRWGEVLLRDPAYHPSLNLDAHSQAFGGLALPPRPRAPRRADLSSAED